MQDQSASLFTLVILIIALVLFGIALYFGNFIQFQAASIGFCVAGGAALLAAAITVRHPK